jgi:hydroxypyruvate reductase
MIKDQKKALEYIFRAGLKAVDPERAVRKYVRRKRDQLFVEDSSYNLDRFKRILLIGAGKGTKLVACLERE